MRFGTLSGGPGCFPLDHEVYPSQSDSRGKEDGIRSLVRLDTREGSLPIQSLYPRPSTTRRCTKIHFGENQLLRCLTSLLLPSTAHRMIFHHQRVRTSTALYGRFILAMDRSHLFGSDPRDLNRAIRTRFRFGSGP